MFTVERKSPPAAAFPPSAAGSAAGIASAPDGAHWMPAATFFAAIDPDAPAVRQWAIEPGQCRWILADEDKGAEALMCGAAAPPRRPFCAEHAAMVYLPRAVDEAAGGAQQTQEPAAEEAI
jgi:hypothetical protein